MNQESALGRYTTTATDSAGTVLDHYSTSFGIACRFLGKRARRDIGSIYALVRLADEIVDGVAEEAGLDPEEALETLDRLEAETESALETRYSTNLIVHAFAATAAANGITCELTRPFFASMRSDLTRQEHTPESLAEYIYGSAEVVGLMCLAVFFTMPGTETHRELELKASARRLGAAFQKVNFLRDLATDYGEHGRCYFPGIDPTTFNESQKTQLVEDIRADLRAAQPGLRLLDPRARIAVGIAHRLFTELTNTLDRTPAPQVALRRVSVNNARKATIAAQVVSSSLFKKGRS